MLLLLRHNTLTPPSRRFARSSQLIKGSLNTFLNAFTYPDRTCYPVASQNTKDFYNLVNVYLDAVLHPRATSDPFVHAQEGWHLELENKEDDLTYKGVVYNEMKGVYSSPDSLLGRESQRSLFPDNTYGVDSGGDPRVIPDLSFDDFVDFHRTKYSPSNSRIFFYGDDDVEKRLELLDEYLSEFEDTGSADKTAIEWQKKTFTSPKREVRSKRPAESAKRRDSKAVSSHQDSTSSYFRTRHAEDVHQRINLHLLFQPFSPSYRFAHRRHTLTPPPPTSPRRTC